MKFGRCKFSFLFSFFFFRNTKRKKKKKVFISTTKQAHIFLQVLLSTRWPMPTPFRNFTIKGSIIKIPSKNYVLIEIDFFIFQKIISKTSCS